MNNSKGEKERERERERKIERRDDTFRGNREMRE